MSEAVSVRKRRSRVEVEKLVEEYEASGLTRDGFCQQRGLWVAALDKYRQRCRNGRDRAPVGCFPWKWFCPQHKVQVALAGATVFW
jgi:hypothetical protein